MKARAASVPAQSRIDGHQKIFYTILACFVASKATSELKRIIRKRVLGFADSDRDASAEIASTRGKQFTVTVGGPLNLSLSGALPFYMFTALRASKAWGVHTQGTKAFSLPLPAALRNMLIMAFAVLPAVEGFVAEDWTNPQVVQFREGHKKDKMFRGSLYAWSALEFFMTIAFTREGLRRGVRRSEAAALAVILGLYNGGFGITAAHELLHKPRRMDKLMGRALLTNVCYLHWEREHLVGHHQRVATPGDPATSRKGQSLFAFLPQTVIGSFAGAWRLHVMDLAKQGQTGSRFGFVLQSFGPSLLWAALLAKVTRRRLRHVLQFFGLQAAVAVLLLETVNYVEHYGLARKKLADGSYEPVNPTHSWNSAHWFSNALLFKLQRHSDHHTFPQRPFQLLRNFEESPQLPTGYLGMVALACVPPAFFKIMDPVVDCHNSGLGDAKAAEAKAAWQFQVWNAVVLVGSIAGTFAWNRQA